MSFRVIPIPELKDAQVFFLSRIPSGGLALLWSLVALLLAGIVYASFGSLDEWSRGTAILRPVDEVSLVRNESSGRISVRHVEHGSTVLPGEPLWTLDTELVRIEQQQLLREQERLAADLRDTRLVIEFLTTGSVSGHRLTTLAQTMIDTLGLQQERLGLQSEAAYQAYRREDAKPASLRKAEQVEDLRRNWQLQDLAQRQFIPQELLARQEALRTLENRQAELVKNLVIIREQLEKATIIAPLGGVVEFVRPFMVGEFVGAGEELVRIVPATTDRFRLVVEVPEREAANLALGQELVLRFNGFPAAEYGSVRGVVTYVPEDSERSASGHYVYRLHGELAQTTIQDRAGGLFQLRPGMSASTRIIIRRTPVYRIILRKLDIRV